MMDHNTDDLERISTDHTEAEPEKYRKRPLHHLILAWFLVAVVLFGFMGTCYWLAFGRF